MLSESDILDVLRAGDLKLPPLRVELAGVEPKTWSDGRRFRPDAYVDARWGTRVYRFVAEIKVLATPRWFRSAIQQVSEYAEATERLPLLICPYLKPAQLEELESRNISGLDLCGNGLIVVPDQLLVMRTGNPNKYPMGLQIRNVYRGTSSLVARVFLTRPRFESVQEVREAIVARGGSVSLATVSKVLKVLEEDLVIRREGRASELIQPDELFERLAGNYRPPEVSRKKSYRWNGVQGEMFDRLRSDGVNLVLTGAASVDRYSVMPRETVVQCYCTSIASIEQQLGTDLDEAPRFPDLELIETQDPSVFFDWRSENAELPAASPTQCWLELQAGDKRQQDASAAVRNRILGELRSSGWSSS